MAVGRVCGDELENDGAGLGTGDENMSTSACCISDEGEEGWDDWAVRSVIKLAIVAAKEGQGDEDEELRSSVPGHAMRETALEGGWRYGIVLTAAVVAVLAVFLISNVAP